MKWAAFECFTESGEFAAAFGCAGWAGWGFTGAVCGFGYRHHAATRWVEDEAVVGFVHQ